MAFVEMKNVSKGYGTGADRAQVLENVNLELERGEFVAIVGFSGAGKSTLLSLIAGLATPDSGSITLDGKPITGPGPDRGVVFQNYSLLPWLTVYENVYLAVDQVFASATPEEKRKRTEHYVRLVNLAHASDRKPGQLSGGMRQRVAVARALAMNPELLLMDEPLGALDALTRAVLQTEIERIWRADRKTVVLITNDVDEGILLADRIIPLSAGPRATLGPAVAVDIERPRDRKAMNHHPRFKAIRAEVTSYLLDSSKKRRATRKEALVGVGLPAPAEAGA